MSSCADGLNGSDGSDGSDGPARPDGYDGYDGSDGSVHDGAPTFFIVANAWGGGRFIIAAALSIASLQPPSSFFRVCRHQCLHRRLETCFLYLTGSRQIPRLDGECSGNVSGQGKRKAWKPR